LFQIKKEHRNGGQGPTTAMYVIASIFGEQQ